MPPTKKADNTDPDRIIPDSYLEELEAKLHPKPQQTRLTGWREVVAGVIQAIMGIVLLVIIARFLGLLD